MTTSRASAEMGADFSWTVILPSLNEGRRLIETVDSALSTAARPALIEVVVVDDHSDDFSGYDVAIAYRGDERVRAVSGLRRLGVGQARHLGALCARGRRLLFLDAHSRFPDRWDEQMNDAVAKCGEGVVYGTALRPLIAVPAEEEAAATAYGVWYDTPDLNEHYSPHREQSDNPYHVMGLPGGSMAMTRQTYFALGGFDPGLMPPWGQENMELCLRAWMMGHEVRVIPNCVIRTYYKPSVEGNPGIKQENMLYNRVRIALLYLGRERAEKAMNSLRLQEWFAEGVAIMLYDRYQSLLERAIEWRIDPDDLFEKFGIDW